MVHCPCGDGPSPRGDGASVAADGAAAVGALAVELIEGLLRRGQAAQPLAQACLVERLAAAVARALGHRLVELIHVADGALHRVVVSGARLGGALLRGKVALEDRGEVEADGALRLPARQVCVE